jgi:isocitrate dehydrogenase kinase/phosphatase
VRLPVLHNAEGKLVLDTILLDPWQISMLFSLSRAYFMVDMEVPSGYVQFLRSIMPNKPRSELYTMLGLGKQGKTLFFRDLMQHLRHSATSSSRRRVSAAWSCWCSRCRPIPTSSR